MDPLNDRDLERLLSGWHAPRSPATLERRVLTAHRAAQWRWLWSGSVKVPVPVALAVCLVLLTLSFVAGRPMMPVHRATEAATATAGFEPVKRLEVRIIRSQYEDSH